MCVPCHPAERSLSLRGFCVFRLPLQSPVSSRGAGAVGPPVPECAPVPSRRWDQGLTECRWQQPSPWPHPVLPTPGDLCGFSPGHCHSRDKGDATSPCCGDRMLTCPLQQIRSVFVKHTVSGDCVWVDGQPWQRKGAVRQQILSAEARSSPLSCRWQKCPYGGGSGAGLVTQGLSCPLPCRHP